MAAGSSRLRCGAVVAWDNPFSFRGRIGRLRFLLTIVVAQLVQLATFFVPVERHIVVGTVPIGGLFLYSTPIEPVNARSWAFFALFYLMAIGAFWVFAAAAVRRLHDLGYSGWWVAVVLAVSALLEAIVFWAPAYWLISMIALIPFALLSGFGGFMMLFVAGDGRAARTANDLRGPL